MKSSLRIIAAVLVLGLGAAGAWACNDDDDSLTMQEYFQRVDTIDNATDGQISQLFDAITDENDIEQFRGAVKQVGPILDKAAKDVKAIDAPKDAEDEQAALVDKLQTWSSAATSAANSSKVQAAATPDELFTAFQEGQVQEAEDNFQVACKSLEQVAADNGITVDLGCEDDEEG